MRFLLLLTSVTAPPACKLLCSAVLCCVVPNAVACCAELRHAVLNRIALCCTNTVCPFADTHMCLLLCLRQVGGGA